MHRPPTPTVPPEYAKDVAGVLNIMTEVWATRLAPLQLRAVSLLPDASPLAFTVFSTLFFTAQLFDQDPEFMHWLTTTSGMMDPDILGAPNEKVIEALKLTIEELNDHYHSAK